MENVKPNINLENTTKVDSPEGGIVFQEGFILRKVSKFIVGTEEDQLVPIPVMFDVKTGKVIKEFIPKEIREEYTTYFI